MFVVRLRDDSGNLMPGGTSGRQAERAAGGQASQAGPAQTASCLTWLSRHAWLPELPELRCRPALAGVRCVDNGPKQGLNGVDNGQVCAPAWP